MLKELIEKIIETKKVAQTEVDFEPVQTYQGRLANRRQALYNLDSLMVDYRNEVLKHSLLMLVTGEEKKAFCDIATEEFSCICLDAEGVFSEIADKIDPQNYINRSSNSFLVEMIEDELKEIAWKAGIQSMPQLKCESKNDTTFADKEEFVDFIKKIILEYVGAELLVIIAISKASEVAIEEQRPSSILPVVLHSDDFKLLDSIKTNGQLFTENIFTIACGKVKKGTVCGIKMKEVTKEEVENTLVAIKNSLK